MPDNEQTQLEEKVKEIQEAWLIGLGYTVPPFKGLHSKEMFKQFLSLIHEANKAYAEKVCKVTGDTSDGYHTFNELYEFRKIYNAILFNEWAQQQKYDIHKSIRHSDGELCFGGGWFIVMAQLPTGQISNHYEMKDWDLFDCEIRNKAAKWDGHTAQDVITRLAELRERNEGKV